MVKSVTGLVFGILLLFFSLSSIILGINGLKNTDVFGLDYIITVIILIIGITGIICSIGLIQAKDWARKYSIIISWIVLSLCFIPVIFFVIGLIMATDELGKSIIVIMLILSLVLFLIISALFIPMIYFLTRRKVKKEFQNK